MQFEYEIPLKDGRLVSVVGQAEVNLPFNPDSDSHVEAIDIESAVIITPDGDEWLEIETHGRVAMELEQKVETRLISEMRGES